MEQSTKLCLGLHTTTPSLGLSLGIISSGELQIIHDRSWDLGRTSSSLIHSYLAELMTDRDWWDIVYVAVATGVGSFTGTRVGVVLARTLGQQLDIPVYGVPSREIDAFESPHLGGGKLLEIALPWWRNHYPSPYNRVLPLYED